MEIIVKLMGVSIDDEHALTSWLLSPGNSTSGGIDILRRLSIKADREVSNHSVIELAFSHIDSVDLEDTRRMWDALGVLPTKCEWLIEFLEGFFRDACDSESSHKEEDAFVLAGQLQLANQLIAKMCGQVTSCELIAERLEGMAEDVGQPADKTFREMASFIREIVASEN